MSQINGHDVNDLLEGLDEDTADATLVPLDTTDTDAPVEPIIRLATLSDLTALRLLWDALIREQHTTYPDVGPDDGVRWTMEMAARLEQQASGDPSVYVSIATEPDGAPLGFLAGRIETRRIGAPHTYWCADHVYVVPDQRGTRLGTAILLCGLAHMQATGVTLLECVALGDDPQWANRGFVKTMTRYMTTADAMLARYAAKGAQ